MIRLMQVSAVAALAFLPTVAVMAADTSGSGWVEPLPTGVSILPGKPGEWKIRSTKADEFTLDSAQSLATSHGEAIEIRVSLRAGGGARALPELVCYDAAGKEIVVPSSLARWTKFVTTNWQHFQRVFPTQPGTTSVRARIRGGGRGTIDLRGLEFKPARIDPYATGALISQPHPIFRRDVVLESNFGVVNRDLVSREDRDGDDRWALLTIDLDMLTEPKAKAEDWRSGFQDDPNLILWSDGAVLKSDTIEADRAPERGRALHFRTKVHPGPYVVRVSDPGRAVAISLDGVTWTRHEGGSEIDLGELPMADGTIEFWIDACYRDRVSLGPAYFDYVRFTPTLGSPLAERLFEAARQKPPQVTAGSVDERRVQLTIDPLASDADQPWPVRCGLPIPQGELVTAVNVAVFNAAGEKIPAQGRVMATWPDGSVRWLFVDFMHQPGARTSYSLAYGEAVRNRHPENPIAVSRTDSGIEVDTGAIRFRVSRQKFGFIENVQLASGEIVQAEPIAAEIREVDGTIWRALDLPVEKLQVEEAGPLHTVIVAATKLPESGKPAKGFHHRARIHAFAGSPVVQIEYFTANTDGRLVPGQMGSMAGHVPVKSFSLNLRPARAIREVISDAGRAAPAGARVQKTEDVAVDVTDGAASESKGPVEGRVALLLEGGGSLRAGLPGFREEFPKAFRWGPNGLQIDLWAPEGGDFEWIEGVGKTHRLTLVYDSGGRKNIELLAAGPVLALASPEWYAGSGALGAIDVAARSPLPLVERALAAHMRDVIVNRVGLGFENYGDHSSKGYIKGTFLWDNNEYDAPAGCIVHFARTGDREALRIGLAGALHYVDVDMIHYSSQHADWANVHHNHSHGAFGHHTSDAPDFAHSGFTQGLLWYSYLTGEPAGIHGACGVADWLVRNLRVMTAYMERSVGNPLITLNAVYEATGDERYLRAAAEFVSQALKWEHPISSGFRAPITEVPAFYSGSPFCGGLLPSALLKFNSWAGVPEIDSMLLRVAQWTLTDVWRPTGIMAKGTSRRARGNPLNISNHLRLMTFAYERTGDPFYLAPPWELVNAAFGAKPVQFGSRATGLVFNYLPWFLAGLQRAGSPQPETDFDVRVENESISLAPGATALATLVLTNHGTTPMTGLRVSLHTRRDVRVTVRNPAPRTLAAGTSAEIAYEITAPNDVNLTCDYNRIAYAHWSAVYHREEAAHLKHRWLQVRLEEPATRMHKSQAPGIRSF